MISPRIQSLFSALLKESQKFPDYNFRVYFTRKVNKNYERMKNLTNEKDIENYVLKNEELLEILKRQTALGAMYPSNKNIIE